MSNMFGKLTTAGLETTGDRLGGSSIMDTGVYDGTVKLAYAGKARSSNAQSVTIHIDINGREFRETLWITNKEGQNFFADKKDPSKKQALPGFTSVEELCLVTTGLPLSEQTVEEKVVSLYDFDLKKEIPQNVPVLTDLIGMPVSVGIVRQIVDKQVKDAAGNYTNSGQTREENVSDKFFHQESGRTVTEVRQGIEEAIFKGKWAEKNTGVTRNKAKGAEGKSGAPKAGPAGAPAAGAPKRTSMFANAG